MPLQVRRTSEWVVLKLGWIPNEKAVAGEDLVQDAMAPLNGMNTEVKKYYKPYINLYTEYHDSHWRITILLAFLHKSISGPAHGIANGWIAGTPNALKDLEPGCKVAYE